VLRNENDPYLKERKELQKEDVEPWETAALCLMEMISKSIWG